MILENRPAAAAALCMGPLALPTAGSCCGSLTTCPRQGSLDTSSKLQLPGGAAATSLATAWWWWWYWVGGRVWKG